MPGVAGISASKIHFHILKLLENLECHKTLPRPTSVATRMLMNGYTIWSSLTSEGDRETRQKLLNYKFKNSNCF